MKSRQIQKHVWWQIGNMWKLFGSNNMNQAMQAFFELFLPFPNYFQKDSPSGASNIDLYKGNSPLFSKGLVRRNSSFRLVFYNIGIELLHICLSISALRFWTPSRVPRDVLVVADRIWMVCGIFKNELCWQLMPMLYLSNRQTVLV